MAWALYDWGNSAFALSVLAVLFPLFLGDYWSVGAEGATVTARLALATFSASIAVSLLAPILGAIADSGGYRKRFLLVLAVLGAVTTASLSLIDQGGWVWALGLFVLASVGYYSANVFYDSLILDVSNPKYYSLVSSFGFSLGYFGGASLLTLHAWMYYSPETFGFSDSVQVVKFAFVTVGIWWIVFLMPLMFIVREGKAASAGRSGTIRAAYQALVITFREIQKYRNALIFLIAYWLYIDGVDTIVRMAVDYGRQIGFDTNDLIIALLITNVIGFPATLIYGRVAERVGAKTGILFAIAVYTVTTALAYFMSSMMHFYMLAIVIGLVQGGVQALSRSMYSRMIPQEKSAEFFGFYNMMGKFAAVIGPIMVGWVSVLSGSPRLAILSVIILFIAGATLLLRVPEPTDAT